MKNNLIKFFMTGLSLLAALSVRAQNYAATNPRSFSEGELNAAVGISDAWIWLQNSIVPLAMLSVFLGSLIILAELYHRQNKILNEALRRMAEAKHQNPESIHE